MIRFTNWERKTVNNLYSRSDRKHNAKITSQYRKVKTSERVSIEGAIADINEFSKQRTCMTAGENPRRVKLAEDEYDNLRLRCRCKTIHKYADSSSKTYMDELPLTYEIYWNQEKSHWKSKENTKSRKPPEKSIQENDSIVHSVKRSWRYVCRGIWKRAIEKRLFQYWMWIEWIMMLHTDML